MSVALKVNDLNAKCMFPHVKAKLVESSGTKKLGNQRLIWREGKVLYSLFYSKERSLKRRNLYGYAMTWIKRAT